MTKIIEMENTLVLTKSSVGGRDGGNGYKKDACGILVVLELCTLTDCTVSVPVAIVDYNFLRCLPLENLGKGTRDLSLLFLFINLFYLFSFGCVGSSLLCAGFL